MKDPMTDNSTVKVTFQDKRNTGSVITSSNTVYCKLTDGYQPSALKVNVVNNNTLRVDFSEAVLRSDDVTGNLNSQYAADLVENYAIDAVKLGTGIYGNMVNGSSQDINSSDSAASDIISRKDTVENSLTDKGSVSVGIYRNGVDERHIVTIRLNQSLPVGRHSLSISNVGDWAAKTDGWRNIINTATVDFEVPSDTSRPSFNLEVQSPEQFKLTANCEIGLVDSKDTFKTKKSNTASKTPVVELQQYVNGTWVTISRPTNISLGDGSNPIMVSRITDAVTGAGTNEYLVETTRDWTEVLDTKGTNNHYYRNSYRLRIAPNKLKNLANGLTNEEIILNLSEDPIMKSMDGASPVIEKIEQAVTANGSLTSNYHVTFSEPVKLSDGSGQNTGANEEGMTPTQDSPAASLYTAYFVKRDASQKTVQAEVNTKNFINAEDTVIRVKPAGDLDAGDWDLYVRGVSDDMGNTAATLSGMITVEAQTVTTNFKVVWAAVSKSLDYSGITNEQGSYIFVKFNKTISLSGGSANVGSTLNYQLNGSSLPTGSNIRAHIQGYDDKASVIDSITIELPKSANSGIGSNTMNYLVSGENAVLTISSDVTSQAGDKLTTEPGYKLPYQYGESKTTADGLGYSSLTTIGDAVWGNDPSEQWSGITGSIVDATAQHEAYVKALKEALASDKYREIMLDPAAKFDGSNEGIKTDLDIKRIVDLDLNGSSINGNVSISTKDSANVMRIKNDNTSKPSSIKGNADNKESDVTLTVDTPNASFELAGYEIGGTQYLTIDKGNNKQAKTVKINGVTSDTFTTTVLIRGNVAISGSNIGFDQKGTVQGNIIVDTASTVNLKGDYDNIDVLVLKKATLNLKEVESAIKIIAQAKGATIIVPDTMDASKKVTIVAEADDILVKYDAADVTLESNGGTFKQQTLGGEAHTKDKEVVVSAGTEADFISKLQVINGSELVANKLVEVITASATSGDSLEITGKDGKSIAQYVGTSSEDSKYKITDISVSTTGTYLKYNAGTGTVTCTIPGNVNVTNEISVKFTVDSVDETGAKITKTITKKITVNITKKA